AVERPGPLVWPLSSSFGASDRFVVDLGDPDGPSNGFVLQTGQSGVPFSPHYRDQTPLWLGGGLLPLPLDAERFRARAVAHERLSPRASPTPAAPPGGPPDAPPPARTP
ncbi:MAG TPA: penicillin acylase family protein, partial [Polyangiaceae bacterium]|nr:penicillin acylase family protein [Polyangiaceae bacterium]